MARLIGTVVEEGFESRVQEDDDGRVHFIANGSIDADGANGQHGGPAAYKEDDSGTDYLENGAMRIKHGKVVCINNNARDIVILDVDNEPKVFPGGVIASMTTYTYPGLPQDDPRAYVDSETIAYMVVPRFVVKKTEDVVLGCRGRITYKNQSIDCVVADLSSNSYIGEMSIAAARALGINPSPRNGGRKKADIGYELWPGQAAPGFVLQPL